MDDNRLHATETPDELEAELRKALRRVDAPHGFAERVLANARSAKAQPAQPFRIGEQQDAAAGARGALLQFTRPTWRVAYAAAVVLAITAGAVHVKHVRNEQRRAEQAVAQFDEAMQVTSHALDNVSAKLQQTQFGNLEKALESHSGGGR